MKRLLLLLACMALIGAVGTVSAVQTPVEGCSASTGVTASGVIDSTTPECEFDLVCVSSSTPCAYTASLRVNGTGQVLGGVRVEAISGVPDAAGFYSGSGREPNPACGPELFRCGFSSDASNNVLLYIPQLDLVKVICFGGGLALFESVSCSFTSLTL